MHLWCYFSIKNIYTDHKINMRHKILCSFFGQSPMFNNTGGGALFLVQLFWKDLDFSIKLISCKSPVALLVTHAMGCTAALEHTRYVVRLWIFVLILCGTQNQLRIGNQLAQVCAHSRVALHAYTYTCPHTHMHSMRTGTRHTHTHRKHSTSTPHRTLTYTNSALVMVWNYRQHQRQQLRQE